MRETSHKVIDDICSGGLICLCGWRGIGIEERDRHFEEVKEGGGTLKQPLIYLASPHSHPEIKVRQERYENVLGATAHFVSRGFFVFSPIVHSHYLGIEIVAKGIDCNNFEYWKALDTEWITKMEELWVAAFIWGWEESKGVKAEIEIAKLQGKNVFYVDYIGQTGEYLVVMFEKGSEEGFQRKQMRASQITRILNSTD